MSVGGAETSRVVRMDLSGSGGSIGAGAPDRRYDVVVARDALLELTARLRTIAPRAQRALLVVDAGLPDALVGKAVGAIAAAGVRPVLHGVEASERAKSLGTLEGVFGAAMRERLERDEPFIALGGGIVGDVAGFAAAVYRRGVPVIQCPTTLLAMVDASVGGKTGVNLRVGDGEAGDGDGGLRKNMVGAFWQPGVVLCDLEALASLPEREFRAGLGECLKHALIGNAFAEPGLLDWMLDRAAAVGAREPGVMAELIARNVGIKCRVVAGDERETRNASATGRAALNAGHTFAHAIEAAYADDHGVLHGEAVGLGLIGEIAVAEELGLLGPEGAGYADRVAGWGERLGLPTRLPTGLSGAVAADGLIAAMRDDKKVAAGRIRLMAPTPDRNVAIVDDPAVEVLRAGLVRLGARA